MVRSRRQRPRGSGAIEGAHLSSRRPRRVDPFARIARDQPETRRMRQGFAQRPEVMVHGPRAQLSVAPFGRGAPRHPVASWVAGGVSISAADSLAKARASRSAEPSASRRSGHNARRSSR